MRGRFWRRIQALDKGRRRMKRATSGAAVLLALAVMGCGGDPCLAGKSVFTGQLPAQCSAQALGTPAAAAGVAVLLVEGSAGSADISYVTPSASASAQNVPLPWSIAMPAAKGDSLFVAALAGPTATGQMNVSVSYGGKLLRQSVGSGASAYARVDVTCCGD